MKLDDITRRNSGLLRRIEKMEFTDETHPTPPYTREEMLSGTWKVMYAFRTYVHTGNFTIDALARDLTIAASCYPEYRSNIIRAFTALPFILDGGHFNAGEAFTSSVYDVLREKSKKDRILFINRTGDFSIYAPQSVIVIGEDRYDVLEEYVWFTRHISVRLDEEGNEEDRTEETVRSELRRTLEQLYRKYGEETVEGGSRAVYEELRDSVDLGSLTPVQAAEELRIAILHYPGCRQTILTAFGSRAIEISWPSTYDSNSAYSSELPVLEPINTDGNTIVFKKRADSTDEVREVRMSFTDTGYVIEEFRENTVRHFTVLYDSEGNAVTSSEVFHPLDEAAKVDKRTN